MLQIDREMSLMEERIPRALIEPQPRHALQIKKLPRYIQRRKLLLQNSLSNQIEMQNSRSTQHVCQVTKTKTQTRPRQMSWTTTAT